MTHGFVKLARAGLVASGVDSNFQLGNDSIIDFFNLLVSLLYFGGGITQAPGTGEIVEIATASFAGEDVINNCLTQFDRVGRSSAAVGHCAITPNGENGAFGVFRAGFCQPEVDLGFDIADGKRLTVRFGEGFVDNLMTGEQVERFLDDRSGDDAHLADAFDLIRTLGGTGFHQDQFERITNKGYFREKLLQARDEGEERSKLTHTIKHNLALPDADILQDLLVAQSGGFGGVILSQGVKRLHRVIGVTNKTITGFCGFVAFHHAVKQDGGLTGDVKQVRVSNMAIPGEINHVGVVLGGTTNPEIVNVVFLHESIKILFHNDSFR